MKTSTPKKISGNIKDAINSLRTLPQFLTQKNSTKPIVLGMNMQVKNKADVIELNIRYHALRRVSEFFIVDNNSTDGTWKLLQKK